MKPANGSRLKSRSIWFSLILVGMLAGAGIGYTYWNRQPVVQSQASAQSVTTKAVRTGSITLAASGTVTLVPGQESDLAFTVAGTVAKLTVAVGEEVQKGDILAQLDNLAELEADVKSAEQDLLTAQQELAAFTSKAPANLANAQLNVIDAQEAVAAAQSSLVEKEGERCSQEVKERLLDRYKKAVKDLEALGDGGGHADYYLNVLLPQKKVVEQALGAYQSCAGYTEYQVASTHANLTATEAELKLAQAALETLKQNEGLDPSGLAEAKNRVATAVFALETARDQLSGATLTAPFDGTVLSVAGKAGDAIEITARNKAVSFITIADLAHPRLQFSIDEMDLGMVSTGAPAQVTFDSFPNRSFHGRVTRVDPAVSSSNGASAVTGLIELDLSQETDVPAFPKNLSGSVQIIQAAVENALLIPLEALHENSAGAYGVYRLSADGRPQWVTVEVGLRNVASVEIVQGLHAGDLVVTSAVQE